jgi:hypothetical protein
LETIKAYKKEGKKHFFFLNSNNFFDTLKQKKRSRVAALEPIIYLFNKNKIKLGGFDLCQYIKHLHFFYQFSFF